MVKLWLVKKGLFGLLFRKMGKEETLMLYKGKRWLQKQLQASKRMLMPTKMIVSDWMRMTTSWLQNNKKTIAITAVGVVGAASIVATATLAMQSQQVETNTSEIFHVYVGDEKAGTVSDPKVVQDFLVDKQERIAQEYPDVHMVLKADAITYESETGVELESEDGATLLEIDQRIEPVAVGVELRVDGERVGIVKDKRTADDILARIQSKYIPKEEMEVSILSYDDSSQQQGKVRLEKIEFVEEVEIQEVESTPEEIMDADQVLAMLEQGDVKPTIYKVQEGDCISCIAQKFDISRQVIYENNPWIEDDFIKVGDELDLTVLQPALSVKTVEEVDEIQPIRYPTEYIQDDTMKVGTTEVVQSGIDGKKKVTYHLTKVNGILVDEVLVNEDILEEPVPAIVKRGTKIIPGEGTGSFRWPVANAKVSSSYGMRWGSLHKGIDLTSKNRNVMAADNGKVTFAGYNRGYGNYIIIDHQNGYKTLYAHLSKINTKKGATVEKGEVIGIMGSTGHSTGVHLHFEIHKNGKVQNPSNYLNK